MDAASEVENPRISHDLAALLVVREYALSPKFGELSPEGTKVGGDGILDPPSSSAEWWSSPLVWPGITSAGLSVALSVKLLASSFGP